VGGEGYLDTNEKVLWLDVAMNDMFLVTIVESFSKIFDISNGIMRVGRGEGRRKKGGGGKVSLGCHSFRKSDFCGQDFVKFPARSEFKNQINSCFVIKITKETQDISMSEV
jgi:hypothetical protein